jgi:DNA-binding winged helix-turn-helix (wHTH) protein
MVLQWERCRFEPETRRLVRDGVERHVSPKAIQLLEHLVAQRPRLLTKEALIEHVWPDTFVSDANLAVLIGEIREAVGDSARQPRVIRTHHRLGYSFIAEVIEVPRTDTSVPTGPLPTLHIGVRRVVLGHGTVVVGRDPSCDVVIPEGSVSKRHARITSGPRGAEVEDLHSKNGTRLDGSPVTRARVKSGARLRLGNVEAEFVIEMPGDAPTLTADDPPAGGPQGDDAPAKPA